MLKLNIFDDDVRIATITQIDSRVFIFARSSREWKEMRRLVDRVDSGEKVTELVNDLLKEPNLSSDIQDYLNNTSENDESYCQKNLSYENNSIDSDIILQNDPPLLHPEIINKMNILNGNIKTKSIKIIDITPLNK